MSDKKIALSMICDGTGNEPVSLRRALNSIAQYIDGIFVTLTAQKSELKEVEKVCKEFNVNVSYHRPIWKATKEAVEWLENYLGTVPNVQIGDEVFLFDKARNFNLAQIPKEYHWIFWMDTDDVLLKGENLWKLKEIGDQTEIDVFLLNYIYRAVLDERGNIKQVLIEHLKERMFKNNGSFRWISPVHEVLTHIRPVTKTIVDDCSVLHLIGSKHVQTSILRNIKILEYAVYSTEGKDPRQVYFLAKTYFDTRMPDHMEKARHLIYEFLWGKYPSQWPEERAQAYEYLCDIYRQKGEFNSAIKSCLYALMEEPERSSIYANLALAYNDKQEWDKSIFWAHLADKIVDKQTALNKTPRDLEVMKLVALYNSYLHKGNTYEAFKTAKKLIKLVPNDEAAKVSYDFVSKQRINRNLGTSFLNIANYLWDNNEKQKVEKLIEAIPTLIQGDPLILVLKDSYNKIKGNLKNGTKKS